MTIVLLKGFSKTVFKYRKLDNLPSSDHWIISRHKS